ncbi:DUF3987 domain-containing protein [Tellurirhabdus rosea]|uniref:DUF3987 domain-containing protein n=1 Tax=Tellurirhabdus rosea TaxID=2674997 RepID=UPI00225C2B5B|nr:DUF3987 domain-containing protein [Tellurirhabdus rosea]
MEEIIYRIRGGIYHDAIASLRRRPLPANDLDSASPQLPAFAVSRRYESSSELRNMAVYTGFLLLDLPLSSHPAEGERIRHSVNEQPETVASFQSACGQYLQVILWTNSPQSAHKERYRAACDWLLRLTDVEPGREADDPKRRCVLSADPAAHFNPAAVPLAPQAARVFTDHFGITSNKEAAKDANATKPAEKEVNNRETTPCIPDWVYEELPPFLKELCAPFDPGRERDVVLISALLVVSACLEVKAEFRGSTHWPNLMGMVLAPPASGKGRLAQSRRLAEGFHGQRLEVYKQQKADYQRALRRHKKAEQEGDWDAEVDLPQKPQMRKFLIPGDSTSASLQEDLLPGESHLIHESETDTLGKAFKAGNGNYSAELRKAFHHEAISVARKTDAYAKEIVNPRLSVALAGTPDQLFGLIKATEDGLFSRFIFYYFDEAQEYQDAVPAGAQSVNAEQHFDLFAQKLEALAQRIAEAPTTFDMTAEQYERYNRRFKTLTKRAQLMDKGADGVIRRFGVIVYRIMMILTTLRMAEQEITDCRLVSNDVDYRVAEGLTDVLLEHTLTVFNRLPKTGARVNKALLRFFDSLPSGSVSRKEAVDIGMQILPVAVRSIGAYLQSLVDMGLLQKTRHGHYEKT